MKETKNVWRVGKTAALLLLAVLLACAVIVPASAEDSSAVFTQQEIQGMMTAGSVFSDVFDNALYNSLDDNAKADYMATVLGSLSGPSGSAAVMMNSVPGLPSANVNRQAQVQYQMQTNNILQQYDLSTYSEPLIDRNSIYYDADAKTFSFVYANGVRGMVKIGVDTCCDGISSNSSTKMTQIKSMIDDVQSLSPVSANAIGDDVLLLFDLTGGLSGTYEALNTITLPGSTYITTPTIEQYKTALDNKKMILISAHGNLFTTSLLPYVTTPGMSVSEEATSSKIVAYDSDLDAQRVGLIYDALDIFHTNGRFVIYPSFFSYYYGDNRGFEGAYIHLGICKGFGENGNEKYDFAYALNQGGGSVVTGYNGEVNAGYDHSMTLSIAISLTNGNNIQTAINSAKSGNTSPNAAYLVTYGYVGWTL